MAVTLHFLPRDHWMNDPNGFIYYRGKYHIFYQYFPYESRWGTMHWGHKTSTDLVHWKDEGIALYPSRDFDRNGCFSGSAIEIDGKMYLYYTAIVYASMDPANIHVSGSGLIACQAMLESPDGMHFPAEEKRIIIPTFSENEVGHPGDTRDPKVWQEREQYFMVLGSRKGEQGNLLLYSSRDGLHWQFASVVSDERIKSHTWECPDIFSIDGEHYLIMSPIGIEKTGTSYPNQSVWTKLSFNPGKKQAKILSHPRFIDYGMDLYAPQSTLDEKGRRIVMAWMRMPRPLADGRIGMLTFPRLVRQKEGDLRFGLHPAVESLFTRVLQKKQAEDVLRDQRPLKISLDLLEGAHIDIGGYVIRFYQEKVYTDRSKVLAIERADLFGEEVQVGKEFCTPILQDGRHLDIYVDANIIEIYVNQDEYVLSNIVYDLGSQILAQGVEKIAYFGLDTEEPVYEGEKK